MAETDSSDSFLFFSDVHFNPFADPSLVASDVSAWKGILASSSKTAYAAYLLAPGFTTSTTFNTIAALLTGSSHG